MDIIKEQFKASDIELFLTSGGPEDVLAADTTLQSTYPANSESNLQELINAQPKNLGGHTLTFSYGLNVNIFVYNGIVIKDFYNGTIVIKGPYPPSINTLNLHFKNQNVHGIEIVNTHCDIIFENITLEYERWEGSSHNVVHFDSAMGNNYFYNCQFSMNTIPASAYIIYATGCTVSMSSIIVSGTYLGVCADNAIIHVKNISEYYYAVPARTTYALLAYRGGVISREGTGLRSVNGNYTASGGTIR